MPAEQSVLGTLLLDPDLYRKIEFLDPDHFADPIHGLIFDLVASEPIVLDEEPDFLDEVGGPPYLAHLETYADPERLLENALEIYACWKKREEESGSWRCSCSRDAE
jgi:replicative DNA helicase